MLHFSENVLLISSLFLYVFSHSKMQFDLDTKKRKLSLNANLIKGSDGDLQKQLLIQFILCIVMYQQLHYNNTLQSRHNLASTAQ